MAPQDEIQLRHLRRVGAAIEGARKDLGKTQEQVSDEADVSRTLIWKIESGEFASVSVHSLMRVMQACGMEMVARMRTQPTLEDAEAARFDSRRFRP